MVKSGVQSKAAENSFNAVRLLAALQVAYIHAIAHLKLAPTWGYEWIEQFPGVPIFFAVSGYLVFDSLLRLRSLKRFAAHRAARIYPALAVNILVMEAALYATGQIDFTRSLSAVWAFLFFICYTATASYNVASLWVGSGGGALSFDGFFQIYPSGVLWTLTVELTFYVAVPIAALMKNRIGQTILISAASVTSFAFQNYLGPDSRLTVTITVAPYFWIFGIGMLFRLWPVPTRSVLPASLMLLAAFTLFATLRHLAPFEWKSAPSSYDTFQTALLCLLVLCVGTGPILKSKTLALNDASYGIYLYHMLIVTALMNIPEAGRSQWLLLVVAIGAILAGLCSWHLVERPIMMFARGAKVSPGYITRMM
jgi:peptidoglycan/LPS O-acetylase OafA/YrhL